MLLGEALLGPDTHMVFAEPSFVVYRTIALARQTAFDAVPLDRHVHNVEAMAAAVRPDTALMIVCEPNNPTGTYVGPAGLRRLLESIPKETVVVFDEAYTEYVGHPDHENTIEWIDEFENLVVLRTFSKIYGLAGTRIGYGVFHPELAQALDKLRQPYNVNSLAQVAAREALRHPEHVTARRSHVRSERMRVAAELQAIGIATVPTEANFMLVSAEGLSVPAEEVAQALLEHGLLVRSGWGIGCPGWMRVTIGTIEENQAFLGMMRRWAGMEGTP
jgi:histidinol-phosphate aminotransferase